MKMKKKKILAKFFLIKKNPEIENFKPKEFLRSSLSSGVSPWVRSI